MNSSSTESTSEMISINVRSEGLPVGNYSSFAICGYPEVGDSVLVLLGEHGKERVYRVKVLDRIFSYAITQFPNSLHLILDCGPLVETESSARY